MIGIEIGRLTNRQVEGEQSSFGIGQTVKLNGEPAPRAVKSCVDAPPSSVRCRDLGANEWCC
jgi:hypothetical protein